MKSNKKLKLFALILASMGVFFYWQNNDIVITEYDYINSKLPKEFDEYKIVQVSDLHNKNYHGRLVKKIININPNIIVITGDLIDRRNTKIDVALNFIEEINDIAPIYYVSGNHEQLSNKYEFLKEKLEELNVNIMDDYYIELYKNKDKIGLMGIADPAINQKERDYLFASNSQYIRNSIEKLSDNINTDFNILLSHRPEEFEVYTEMKIDLVFAGHAHGGQIRLPFVGGLFAPHQGLFPKYTNGMYTLDETSMIVSRGLGNSIFPLRIFNRPELVVVTLHTS
ncbi:metallophosphoesterase [Defluviitalea phaphyphila]|uniref:metallophosphoesterase n=1 Tax=Defluviitalea phaphyphila TaxID=1473580 RepID=UPI00072FB0BA|nr:metallophosphoesterase [Defluviitalea phaphyphila]